MASVSADRRRFLLSTATWLGGIAGITAIRPAEAFEIIVAQPQSRLALAYADRCRPEPDAREPDRAAQERPRGRSNGRLGDRELPGVWLPRHGLAIAHARCGVRLSLSSSCACLMGARD